jgi:hypothetical protein
MSVRTMTTEALQNDLEVTMLTWGGEIPPEQTDRVNAMKSELKRRGAETTVARPGVKPKTKISAMDDDKLAAELKKVAGRLEDDPDDEQLQTRFADIRFELRKRAKAAEVRKLEPDDEEYVSKNKQASNRGAQLAAELDDVPEPAPLSRKAPMQTQVAAIQAQADKNIETIRALEERQRKYQLAAIASNVAARLLDKAKHDFDALLNDNPAGVIDGDDIEMACNVGVQVANAIFAKVGL